MVPQVINYFTFWVESIELNTTETIIAFYTKNFMASNVFGHTLLLIPFVFLLRILFFPSWTTRVYGIML